MMSNPYLLPHRLQDVLASLQFLATYPDYDLTVPDFREKIASSPRSASNWDAVFSQHPEFFRKSESEGDFSLVLRRAKPKNSERTRPALTPEELATLIETAIELQKQALELHRERRAWLPVAASFVAAVSGFAGSVIGAAIGK